MDLETYDSLRETLYEAESVLQEIFNKHSHTPLQHLTHDDQYQGYYYHTEEKHNHTNKASPRKANVDTKKVSSKLAKGKFPVWQRPVRTHPYLKQLQAQKEKELNKNKKQKNANSPSAKPNNQDQGSPSSTDAMYTNDFEVDEMWNSPFAVPELLPSNSNSVSSPSKTNLTPRYYDNNIMKFTEGMSEIIMMDNGNRVDSEDCSTVQHSVGTMHSLASSAHTAPTLALHNAIGHPRSSESPERLGGFQKDNSILQPAEDEAVDRSLNDTSSQPKAAPSPPSSSAKAEKGGNHRVRRSSGYGQQQLLIPSPAHYSISPTKTPTVYDPMAFPFTSIQMDSDEDLTMDAIMHDSLKNPIDVENDGDADTKSQDDHQVSLVPAKHVQPLHAITSTRRNESKSTPKLPMNKPSPGEKRQERQQHTHQHNHTSNEVENNSSPRTPKRPSSAPSQRSPRVMKANQTPTTESKAHFFSTPTSVNTTMTRTMESPDRKNALPIEIKMFPKSNPPPISHDFLVDMLVQKLNIRRSERLQRQAAKKKGTNLSDKAMAGMVVKDDHDVPSSNNATTNELLESLVFKVPALNYQVYYDDWVNSSVMLDSLDSEQDDLHDRVSSLYVALSDVQSSEALLPHFLEAVSILLSLHNDLHCPWQQHQRFWKAHCLNRSHHLHGSLVSILSRIALLNKSRSILLTLCRCLISRGTVLQDRWLCEYAAKLYNGKHGLFATKPKANANAETKAVMTPASVSNTPQPNTPAAPDVISAPEDSSPLARTFLSQYKSETSKDSQFSQTANQIRAGARKTLNFAKQMATFQSPLMNTLNKTTTETTAPEASIEQKKDTDSVSASTDAPKPVAPKVVSPAPFVRDMRLSVIKPMTKSGFSSQMLPPHLLRQPSMPAKPNNLPPSASSNTSNTSGNISVSKMAAMTLEEGDEDEEDDDDEDEDNDHGKKAVGGNEDKDEKKENGDDEDEDEDEDEEEIEKEEEELIKKRREQFRSLSQRMSNPDTPNGSPVMKSPAAGGNRKSIFNKKESEQPVKLDDIIGGQKKPDGLPTPTDTKAPSQGEPMSSNNASINQAQFYLFTPPEVLETLVHVWTSSVPWKVEKFYFAGADYKSPLTKLQLTLSAMNQTVDEDGKQPSDAAPTTMRRVSVIKRRPSSANSSLQLRRQSMTSSPSHHAASDTSVIDSEMEDELRRGILQPKMSLPL